MCVSVILLIDSGHCISLSHVYSVDVDWNSRPVRLNRLVRFMYC